jgi:predicted DNA-binding transcriptional regulator AlpA
MAEQIMGAHLLKLLNAKAVAHKTSFSIPHIRRLAKNGRFPQSIKISDARHGWLETDIDEWITQCILARGKKIDGA